METQFDPSLTETTQIEESIALGRMISQLILQFQPAAVLQQSFIVNDIPTGFYVDVDKNILASVISYLFGSMINTAKNSCIRVTAKRYNNIILLRLSDESGGIATYANDHWHEMKVMAEKIGGCILADDVRKKPSTITLSFRCLANAA